MTDQVNVEFVAILRRNCQSSIVPRMASSAIGKLHLLFCVVSDTLTPITFQTGGISVRGDDNSTKVTSTRRKYQRTAYGPPAGGAERQRQRVLTGTTSQASHVPSQHDVLPLATWTPGRWESETMEIDSIAHFRLQLGRQPDGG